MTSDVDSARIVSLADRPELAAEVPAILGARWPRFLLEGRPGHDADLLELLAVHAPTHQVALLGDDGQVLGVGLSVPVRWDGTPDGLPAGWDGAVGAAADLVKSGGTPNAVCALSITMTEVGLGRNLSARVIGAFKAAAASAGAATLIAPVRPTLKHRYPLIPMERYLAWRTPDGSVFDPWVRLHLRLGGRQEKIAFPSMTISGSIAEWEDWTGLALPGSGDHVFPGGLVPLRVDHVAGTVVYQEPNVWIIHRVE